jgi:DNA-binding NarL/FixJ family response regulator
LLIGEEMNSIAELSPLKNGWGILPIEASSDALRAAIYAIDQGLVVMSPSVIKAIKEPYSSPNPGIGGEKEFISEPLSGRELEVLNLIGRGLQNKQIAQVLQLSENTVKFHISTIYSKLNVNNRTEAAAKGARLGLVAL